MLMICNDFGLNGDRNERGFARLGDDWKGVSIRDPTLPHEEVIDRNQFTASISLDGESHYD
jgi:hypothetical protein